MSDTATTTRRSPKPRDVDYTLEVVDDLPDSTPQQRSVLEDQLAIVKQGGTADTPIENGKYACIGRYHLGSAASAAANTLRQRHGGDASVEGWTFRTKRLAGDDKRTGLFVRYTPEAIVEGARETWDQKENERKAALKAKKEANGGEAKEEAKPQRRRQ